MMRVESQHYDNILYTYHISYTIRIYTYTIFIPSKKMFTKPLPGPGTMTRWADAHVQPFKL